AELEHAARGDAGPAKGRAAREQRAGEQVRSHFGRKGAIQGDDARRRQEPALQEPLLRRTGGGFRIRRHLPFQESAKGGFSLVEAGHGTLEKKSGSTMRAAAPGKTPRLGRGV